MDVLISWIIELIDQDQLINENEEHEIELHCGFELTILENISKDDDLVQKNQLSQVDCSLSGLLLRNSEQELLFGILEIEGEEVLWSLHKIVDLVLCSVLDDESIIEVEVIVKAKDVHGAVIDLVGLVCLVFYLFILLVVLVVIAVKEPSVTVVGSLTLVARSYRF